MTPENQKRTQEKAHQIWESEGRPGNRNLDHWLQAEGEIKSENPKPKKKPLAMKST